MSSTTAPVTVYIEGDGQSWIKPNKISPNPTPLNPLALILAQEDNHPNVVYLARPCQYTAIHQDEYCHSNVWTDERFSLKVISSMNHALDQIKQLAKVDKVQLVGFSGGGGLAVLMAAKRKNKDILNIRTVAADLDTAAMAMYHHATPTKHSLNPRDYAKAIKHIPQIHFVGGADPVVPISIAKGFLSELNQNSSQKSLVKLRVLQNQSHHTGWQEAWTMLQKE